MEESTVIGNNTAAGEQVAVVTGTSSGIGLHTAVGLAREGIRVVATMRDTDRSGPLLAEAAAQGVEVAVRALDVTEHDGARACLDAVAAEFGPVGILVNNAGRVALGTLEQLDDAALRRQLEVNFLGAAALTRHVLPGMRESGTGRVVTLTSETGVVGQPFLDAYCASKFAVEGLMQALAPVAERFGVAVSVVEPAFVATNLAANMDLSAIGAPGDAASADGPYGELVGKFFQAADGNMARAQEVREAAAVVVEAATTDTPRFRWQTSETAAATAALSLSDLDGGTVVGTMSKWLG